ncbi:hypothetical protein [Mesorhizobium sp. 43Arga]
MKLSEMVVDPRVAAFLARGERDVIPATREIVVERVPDGAPFLVQMTDEAPDGWFIVEMTDEAGNELLCHLWECAELAFADAEAMKDAWGPAVIRDKTGSPQPGSDA